MEHFHNHTNDSDSKLFQSRDAVGTSTHTQVKVGCGLGTLVDSLNFISRQKIKINMTIAGTTEAHSCFAVALIAQSASLKSPTFSIVHPQSSW